MSAERAQLVTKAPLLLVALAATLVVLYLQRSSLSSIFAGSVAAAVASRLQAIPSARPWSSYTSEATFRYVTLQDNNQTQLTTRSCGRVAGLRSAQPQQIQRRKGKVISVLPYSNERDLLLVKLSELQDVVDLFLIVEATLTHSGNPKPLNFEREPCSPDFAPFAHKLVYVVLNNTAEQLGWEVWQRENAPREAVTQFGPLLGLQLQPHDLILVTDVDELVTAPALEEAINTLWEIDLVPGNETVPMIYLAMGVYYYNLHHKVLASWWDKAQLVPFAITEHCTFSATRKREDCKHKQDVNVSLASGAHCSYFMSPEAISLKLQSFAHTEYNLPENTAIDTIRSRIRRGMDVTFRPNMMEYKKDPAQEPLVQKFRPTARERLLALSERLYKLQELD